MLLFLLPAMPFASQAQQRFAFATGQPWAKRWADETDFTRLPKRARRLAKRKALCTCKGEQIRPGVTRIRGNLCNVHGRYGPCDPAAGKPKKPAKGRAARRAGRKPPKTTEQRAAERQARRDANRTAVADALANADAAVGPTGIKNILAAADGSPIDAQHGAALEKLGMAEQNPDGTYRLSTAANVLVNAMNRGDARAALDAIGRGGSRAQARDERATAQQQRQSEQAARRAAREQAARDREAKRQERQQALAKRRSGGKQPAARQETAGAAAMQGARPPRGRAGGTSPVGGAERGSDKPRPAADAPEKQLSPKLADAVQRLSDGAAVSDAEISQLVTNGLVKINKDGDPVLTAAGQRATKKSFRVYKDASGVDRWLLVSSTAYRDRDQEIVSCKALTGAVALADASGYRGPLRFWHVPGVDLGDCDFQATAQDGRFLIESGTFRSPAIAAVVKAHADRYQVSIGFTHPANEPDAQGVFHHIAIFERSLVPRGRAANPFTEVVYVTKESRMLTPEKETELKELTRDAPGLLEQLLTNITTTDKAAQDGGATYKDDLRALIREELRALVTEKAAEPPIPAESPALAEAEAEVKAEFGEEMVEEEAVDENMLTEAEIGAIANAVVAALMPHLDIERKVGGYLGEMKTLLGGMAAQKDAALAEVKTELATVKAQVDDLSGSQPRILAGGFRASTAAATVTTDDTKIKEAQPAGDPIATSFQGFMADMGFGPATPGV